MNNNRILDESERLLFKMAMLDATPLQRKRDVLTGRPKTRFFKKSKSTKSPNLSAPVSLQKSTKPGRRLVNELDRKTRSRIQKGRIKIGAKLDLHGLTQLEAHAKLTTFIEKCQNSDRRLLLVITGKGRTGTGILRERVPVWLNDYPINDWILGCSGAHTKHGGEGAFYIVLRRQKKEN